MLTFEASTTGARHLQSGTSVPIFLLVNSYPDWLHRQIVHPHDWGSCARVEKLSCYTSRVAFLYMKTELKKWKKKPQSLHAPAYNLVLSYSSESLPRTSPALFRGYVLGECLG